MQRFAGFLSIVVMGVMTCIVPVGAQQSKPADGGSARQIDQVLSEIQVALLKVQNDAANNDLPKLASVTLELEAEFAQSAAGELNLYVISIGGNVESENTQHVTLSLVPPQAYSEQPVASGQVSESLSTAIIAAAKGVASARRRKPPLVLSKLEAEIRFVVKTVGEGGIKTELLPITASLKGEIKKSAVQVIKVTFESEK
jgi:hypothetical protein